MTKSTDQCKHTAPVLHTAYIQHRTCDEKRHAGFLRQKKVHQGSATQCVGTGPRWYDGLQDSSVGRQHAKQPTVLCFLHCSATWAVAWQMIRPAQLQAAAIIDSMATIGAPCMPPPAALCYKPRRPVNRSANTPPPCTSSLPCFPHVAGAPLHAAPHAPSTDTLSPTPLCSSWSAGCSPLQSAAAPRCYSHTSPASQPPPLVPPPAPLFPPPLCPHAAFNLKLFELL